MATWWGVRMRPLRDLHSLPPSRRAALACVMLVVAGCSSDAAGTSHTSADGTGTVSAAGTATATATGACASGPLAVTCLAFDFAGDVTLQASDVPGSTPSALACREWAAGGNELAGADRFTVPFPDGPVGGHAVAVLATITGYTGPGAYDIAELAGLGDTIQMSVDDAAFESTGATTGTVTVNGDGSGSLVIDGLARLSIGTDGPPALSGSLRWTCTEAS